MVIFQAILVLIDIVVLLAALVIYNRYHRGAGLLIAFLFFTGLIGLYAGLLLATYELDRDAHTIASPIPGQFCIRIQEREPLSQSYLVRLRAETPLYTAYENPDLLLPCMGDSGPKRRPGHWLPVHAEFVHGRSPLPDSLRQTGYSISLSAPVRVTLLVNALLFLVLGLVWPLARGFRRCS